MNKDQAESLARSVLKIAGAVAATYGWNKLQTVLSVPDVALLLGGIFSAAWGAFLSHQRHSTDHDSGM